MKMRLCLIILLTAVAFTANAGDDSAFGKANRAYAEGRFEEAATGYENLIRSGNWNADLFYDLGNARYRLGDFGQAILNFERALALDPRHAEAEANLRLARDEGRALELRRDWIERYAGMATVKQDTIAAAIAMTIRRAIAKVIDVRRAACQNRISHRGTEDTERAAVK